MATEGGEPGGNTPQEFRKHIADAVAKWSEVARLAGIKPR
jgi:tripartite-type tricarboxylate transporter receptor subunit TctC